MDIHNCGSIEEVRARIDATDRKIIALIKERSEYVRRAAAFKKDEDAVRAPARVETVIAKIRSEAAAVGLDPDLAEAVYRTMIDRFIRMELNVHRTVGIIPPVS